MKTILCNAFSLQMFDLDTVDLFQKLPMTLDEVKSYLQNGFTSAIGHQDTANILTNILGIKVEFNRTNVKLDDDTILIVAQVTGGRLPEGATTLPEGTTLKYIQIKLM